MKKQCTIFFEVMNITGIAGRIENACSLFMDKVTLDVCRQMTRKFEEEVRNAISVTPYDVLRYYATSNIVENEELTRCFEPHTLGV